MSARHPDYERWVKTWGKAHADDENASWLARRPAEVVRADASRRRLLRAIQGSSVPGAEEMAAELQGVISFYEAEDREAAEVPEPYSWLRHFSREGEEG